MGKKKFKDQNLYDAAYSKNDCNPPFMLSDLLQQKSANENQELIIHIGTNKNIKEEKNDKYNKTPYKSNEDYLTSLPKKLSNKHKYTSLWLAERLMQECTFRIFCDEIYIQDDGVFKIANVSLLKGHLAKILTDTELSPLTANNLRDAAEMFFLRYSDKIPKAQLRKGQILFSNGLLDVKTGNFVKQTDDDFMLFKVNASYHPDKKIPAPMFKKFINTITNGDKYLKDFFMEFLGYMLLQENCGRSFFVLGPERNSGKTSICLFLERLIGEAHVSYVELQKLDRYNEIESLKGKVLNIQADSEMRVIAPAAVGQIKRISYKNRTYTDMQNSEEYQRFFPKFIIEASKPLILKEPDAELWKSITVIPFVKPVAFEDEIENLLDTLWKERDGIVQKAVKGARRLINNDYEFTDCTVSELLRTQWEHNEVATIGSFIENCCIIDLKPETRTHTADLYDAYLEFCEDTCIDAVTENAFSRTLKGAYDLKTFRCKNGGQKPLRGFEGICLKNAN